MSNENKIEPSTLSEDDAQYLKWARDLGFDLDIQVPNVETENPDEYVPVVRNQIDNWFNENYVPVIDALWDAHVPDYGECTVLQGELARCIGRLEGEYFKNGMMNMGGGYYDRMVDMIAETVLEGDSFSALVRNVMLADCMVVKDADYEQIVNSLSSIFSTTDVEESLNRIKMVVAAWCVAHPVLIDFTPGTSE